jgi:hypothetical protein
MKRGLKYGESSFSFSQIWDKLNEVIKHSCLSSLYLSFEDSALIFSIFPNSHLFSKTQIDFTVAQNNENADLSRKVELSML